MKFKKQRPIALLIENDPLLLYPLEELIEEIGFSVLTAEDKTSAKKVLENRHDFDLVILDLFLGRVADGWGVANIFDDKVSRRCERIIYSGHSSERIRAEDSRWRFVEKGGGGLEQLLSLARAAYSKAQRLPPPDSVKARHVIRSMRPDHWDSLYVLGCFDQRITLYSQQARALALIRSLYETSQLQKGSSVAIVGAGVAGATAAVAAACLECKVKLFDQAAALFHLQERASHRYLHPHIYDWPKPGSLQPDAKLPFLNWAASPADKVAQTLKNDFKRYEKAFNRQSVDRLKWMPQHRITSLEKVARSKILLKGQEGNFAQEFDVVILAIGYGVELETPYWSGDYLDGPFTSEPYRILVSGAGDGGLIDLARATLRTGSDISTFRHDQAVRFLTRATTFKKLAQKMYKIDEEARLEEEGSKAPVNLYSRYAELKVSQAIINKLKKLKRPETKVTFHYRKENPFKLNSALVNRLLAFLLLRSELINFEFGEMKEKSTSSKTKLVTFKHPDRSKTQMEFDLIIRRYGPPKTYFKTSFENVYRDCGYLSNRVELQLTGRLDEDTIEFWKVFQRRSDIG